MQSPSYRRTGGRSPQQQQRSSPRRRDSSSSDSSSSSQVTTLSIAKRPPNLRQQASRSNFNANPQVNASTTTLQNFSRPTPHASGDLPPRKGSPLPTPEQEHRVRQHSQGFFEPSLPTATSSNMPSMANLTASQIAAQAAMQHQFSAQHMRKRSQTTPQHIALPEAPSGRRNPTSPPPISTGQPTSINQKRSSGQQYHNGLLGGHTAAAATAANAAFPRSPIQSPTLPSSEHTQQILDKDLKQKTEKSKIKLFSKPKSIGIIKDRDFDKRNAPLLSPNKMGTHGSSPLPKMANASTTSLADSMISGAPSLYSATNASVTTLTPMDKASNSERHKHHFLSRQKHKIKDKDDYHHLPLSSASSNSKPLDPAAPQSLYSFAPSSPGPTTNTFAKSMSGLDLRHGGRALREKKKEEKASAAATAASTYGASYEPSIRDREYNPLDRPEWPGPSSLESAPSFLGPPTAGSMYSIAPSVYTGDATPQIGLQGFGLSGMTPDDAWPFLKAKLLVIFEGEDLRLPIEDLNRLVSAHLQRCVQNRAPTIRTEDLQDLLQTGFLSLEQTLRQVPDERLVTHLVEMWLFVFSTILPYMQAVFLPLDLEFKGHGTIMSSREAAEFWGALPEGENSDTALGEELDVRRIVLISYRDIVILRRHDTLKAIFSRLSLDSINAGTNNRSSTPDSSSGGRPGTAASLDPGLASFNSQGSTLLNDSAASLGTRSRATSNTSSHFAPSSPPHLPFPTVYPVPPAPQTDSSHVTETVGRMLQCVSVLASVQSGDDAQQKMEGLSKVLKHNWLGRARTGRNRRGFVGTRIRPRDEGSPTPTPSARSGGREEGRRGSML
ncbi:MAG: hypothetical protein M1812_004960 [Candelaria pacifica]|nr:MAG: hypothetical protein M1812_004960 [Candelaria pacifica]